MQRFISCDWGTSSFRVKLINASDLSILIQSKTNEGIAVTYRLWQQSNLDDAKRIFFYQSIIGNKIKEFEKKLDISLEGITIIISGMASSSLGMINLPYHDLPFSIEGSDLFFKEIPANTDFNYHVILISGVRSSFDIIRGEETQLIGCNINPGQERVYIFPGTHSKHVLVKKGKALELKTYMTGELLDLLSTKSILTDSVERHDRYFLKAFEKGIRESLHSNLLNKFFTIRTNQLFEKFSKPENYDYLRGLLIGAELKELLKDKKPVTLAASEPVKNIYQAALQILNIDEVEIEDSEQATIKGHYKILILATAQSFKLNKTTL